jgi:hypothetical protein
LNTSTAASISTIDRDRLLGDTGARVAGNSRLLQGMYRLDPGFP